MSTLLLFIGLNSTLKPFDFYSANANRSVAPATYAAPSWGQWAGARGGDAHHAGMVIHQSERWHAWQKVGRAVQAWQEHQFHETFPPLHLKAWWHNHERGRCTMKWNGRPDPGERTQRRVHRNEGHSLPRDGSVSRTGPAGPGRTADTPSFSSSCQQLIWGCFLKLF